MKKRLNVFSVILLIIIILAGCSVQDTLYPKKKDNKSLLAFAAATAVPTQSYEVKVGFYDEYGDPITPEIISEEEYKQRKANGELKINSQYSSDLNAKPKFFGAIVQLVVFTIQAVRATVNTIRYVRDKDRKKSPSKGCEVAGGFNTWMNTFESPIFDAGQSNFMAKPYDYNQSMPEGCLSADVEEIKDLSTGKVYKPTPVQINDPTVSPDGGTFSSAQSVAINTSQTLVAGLKPSFRYTTDNTNPSCFNLAKKTTAFGSIYTGPISINPGVSFTLKVIACGAGIDSPSSIVQKSFTVTGGSGSVSGNDNVFDWGTFTDNNNGTISFTGVAGTFGGTSYTAANLLFRKCTQGQTYNAGNNDCTGTGSAPRYGATSVQYCSSENNLCNGGSNTGTLTTPTGGSTSSLLSSCLALNGGAGTNGRTNWRVPTLNEMRLLVKCNDRTFVQASGCGAGNFTGPTIPSIFTNTPYADFVNDKYWTSTSYLADGANAVGFFNPSSSGNLKSVDTFMVRCVSTSP